MARHEIFVVSPERTTLKNLRKSVDHYPLLHIEEGENRQIEIDFTEYLEAAETVSSTSTESDNVTVAVATSSPTVTLTISGVSGQGYVDVTVTLSSGRIWFEKIRVRNTRIKVQAY